MQTFVLFIYHVFQSVVAACDYATQQTSLICSIANHNNTSQFVLSGHRVTIDVALSYIRSKHKIRVVWLPVSEPFHCRLMADAVTPVAQALSTVTLQPPRIPVISNVTATPYPSDISAIRQLLLTQITSPVQWHTSIQYLISQLSHYERITWIECGSRVLINLMNKGKQDDKMKYV